jgi:predicted nucleic acid-binding protein
VPSGEWRQTSGAPAASRLRAYDAMIAAIALSRGLPVHTANPVDFVRIEGLTVVALPPA